MNSGYERRKYPEKSWSISKMKTLNSCEREYYYTYYGSHNGWIFTSSEEQKIAWRLKKLTNLWMCFGEAVHKQIRGIINLCKVDKSKIGYSSYDHIKFKVKNIGVGPARALTIKIGDEYVETYGGLIEKNDLGVNEEIIISITTDYKKLLNNNECTMILECADIYNKRKYIFEVRAIKQEGYTSVEYYELKDEKIKEL